MIEKAEAVKSLTHPFLSITLVISWIAMIFAGIEAPLAFEGVVLASAGSWVAKRSYKTYKDVSAGGKSQETA